MEPMADGPRVRVSRRTFVHPIDESEKHDQEVNAVLAEVFERELGMQKPTTEIIDVGGVPHLVTYFWLAEKEGAASKEA